MGLADERSELGKAADWHTETQESASACRRQAKRSARGARTKVLHQDEQLLPGDLAALELGHASRGPALELSGGSGEHGCNQIAGVMRRPGDEETKRAPLEASSLPRERSSSAPRWREHIFREGVKCWLKSCKLFPFTLRDITVHLYCTDRHTIVCDVDIQRTQTAHTRQ